MPSFSVSNLSVPASSAADLPSCDAERIQFSSAIQPPGMLLVVSESDQVIHQASENASELLASGGSVLGNTLSDVLPDAFAARIRSLVREGSITDRPVAVQVDGSTDSSPVVLVHRSGDQLIVEIDPPGTRGDDFQLILGQGLSALTAASTVEELAVAASKVVRSATGFDRVMVYQFDREWNGQVVGESLADGVESWMGLRYPASDIPSQARAMYVRSRTRLIADVNCKPVPILPTINPQTQKPVDLTHSVNRSVSPVHLEYLRNMGVGASMSMSIVWQDKLWGMILCHHPTPRRVSYRARVSCDLLAQNLSLHVSVREFTSRFNKALEVRAMLPRLLKEMTDIPDMSVGLGKHLEELCDLGGGAGVAVCTDRIITHGETPDPVQLRGLIDWLGGDNPQDIYCTDALPVAYPPAADFKHAGSGLLAASISRTRKWFVLWFRPEVFRTRYWAGDPKKPVDFTANGQVMRPRTNFQRWRQTLELHSINWEPHHVEAVTEFRTAAIGIVLRQAEERARLASELERSNKELEAFSYSVSHDLRAPFRHIVGFGDLLQRRNKDLDPTSQRYLKTIVDSARFAGTLVDGLLTFSQMGRAALRVSKVDLADVIADVRAELAPDIGSREIEWTVAPLPLVSVDPVMLRLVIRNLLSNAVKYTRDRTPARISVQYRGTEDRDDLSLATTEPAMLAASKGPLLVFEISDNGAGFDMRYVDKLFGVFQRLHKAEEFEGTGIGLANVRRIIERHGGRVSATGEVGKGATIRFTLPSAPTATPEAT